MVKADATEPKTWMEFVKEVRDKNPGMALKDILRLASKLRGKSSSGNSGKSGKKQKKRGGMILPILGGATGDIPHPAAEGPVAAVAAEGPVAAEAEGQVAAAPAVPLETQEVLSEGGRKSKKRRKSNKSQKKSRKSKSKKTKRRH